MGGAEAAPKAGAPTTAGAECTVKKPAKQQKQKAAAGAPAAGDAAAGVVAATGTLAIQEGRGHVSVAATGPADHTGAGREVVHWRKKGWDWDAWGRPCGELDVRVAWSQTSYVKPAGWPDS